MSEWISVEDRLPDNDQVTICKRSDGMCIEDPSRPTNLVFYNKYNPPCDAAYSIATYSKNNDEFTFYSVDFDSYILVRPTHWMPLPDPPTPENGYRSDLDDGDKSEASEITDYLKGLSVEDRGSILHGFCGVCHEYTGGENCYCYE